MVGCFSVPQLGVIRASWYFELHLSGEAIYVSIITTSDRKASHIVKDDLPPDSSFPATYRLV